MKKIFLFVGVLSVSLFSNRDIPTPSSSNRRHASHVLEITENTEPPYHVFQNVANNLEQYRDFGAVMLGFAQGNDLEDAVGLRYLAKFYQYYCPEPASEHFKKLAFFDQMAVKEMFGFPQKVFQEAKKLAHCAYSN